MMFKCSAWILLITIGIGYAQSQANNLKEGCGGTSPTAVTEAFPFTAKITAEVPQRCLPDPVDSSKERCYYYYIPEGVTGKVPLVMDSHGVGSCPVFSTLYTGWAEKAKEKGFVLIYPLGVTNPSISQLSCFALSGGLEIGNDLATPDCCCQEQAGSLDFVNAEGINDTDFLKAIIDDAIASVGIASEGVVSIDPKRVYLTGHSNGCIASLAVAARYSDSIAAVGCYAGTVVTPFALDYSATPVWMAHGLLDRTLPYDGIETPGSWGLLSIPKIFSYVAEKNECAEEIIWDNTTLGNQGFVQTRSGCSADANVTIVTLNFAGHAPYLGVQSDEEGSQPTTVDTTQLAWEFLSSFALALDPVAHVVPTISQPVATEPTTSPEPTSAPAMPKASDAPVTSSTAPVPTSMVPTTDDLSSRACSGMYGLLSSIIPIVVLIGALLH